MQEEVENKTVHLAIQSGKVTVKTLLKGLHAWYRHHQRKKDVAKMSGENVKGKQSVKELIGQGQGVSSMDIGDSGIKDFKKIANKYGVDFAIVKNKEPDSPKYVVFFKARDADAIDQVQQECAAKLKKKKEHSQTKKPSVLQKLKKFKEKVASKPRKQKEKKKEHER